jgi:hypothetical protein
MGMVRLAELLEHDLQIASDECLRSNSNSNETPTKQKTMLDGTHHDDFEQHRRHG